MFIYFSNLNNSINRIKNPIKKFIEKIKFNFNLYKFKRDFNDIDLLTKENMYEIFEYISYTNINEENLYIERKDTDSMNILFLMNINFVILIKKYISSNLFSIEFTSLRDKINMSFYMGSKAFKKESILVEEGLHEIMREVFYKKEGIEI